MTWLADHWLDLFGWAGSALLIVSLLQARVLRFRVLNLVAGLMLVLFNALIGVWPMVAMNLATSAINIWFIARLLRDRHDGRRSGCSRSGRTTSTSPTCSRCTAGTCCGISRTSSWDGVPQADRRPFLILKGDETVGVVIIRLDGDVAHVELDYVTKRFRDFSPGEFVWRESGVLRGLGIATRRHLPGHGRPLLRTGRLPARRRVVRPEGLRRR